MSWKRFGFISVAAAILSILLCFSAGLLIRHIGELVTLLGPGLGLKKREIQQFSAIFGQLIHASFRFPVIPSLLLSAASAWLISAIRIRKKAVRITLQILLSLLLIIILFVITLLLTNVNTIRFVNVLLSLLTVLTA